ncbi:MAG: ORF6C domain-containing protein [Lachnospiraceae bacterium]|nr:ORF6C domain-containing protein [Lachnospiraceae bacterium]
MNEVQIFSNSEFGEIRTVMIDGEPWFVAKDISEKLGYAKPANMVKLVDAEDKRNVRSSDLEPRSKGVVYQISMVNESGLYAAIFGSKQENAKKFKAWVTKEVLPSIRKTGSYGQPQLPDNPMKLLEIHYEALKQVDKKVDSVSEEVNTVKSDLQALKMDLPILPVEADRITEAVKKKGVAVLGGKESNAYNNRSIRQKVYNNIYSNLKYNFGVKSYKSIKRSQCDRAIEIIQKYEPPFFLSEMIQNENAQRNMKL